MPVAVPSGPSRLHESVRQGLFGVGALRFGPPRPAKGGALAVHSAIVCRMSPIVAQASPEAHVSVSTRVENDD